VIRCGEGPDHHRDDDDDGAQTKIEVVADRSSSPSPQTTQAPASKRKARIEAATSVLFILRQRWPDTFARLSARTRRPLKVGIRDDVIAALPDIPPALISFALGIYTSGVPYRSACIEGAARIGLGGPAGVVSPAEAAHARAQIDKRQRREKPKASSPAPSPRRITLTDLRAAAARRRGAVQ
jgi:sRNA-binding protein